MFLIRFSIVRKPFESIFQKKIKVSLKTFQFHVIVKDDEKEIKTCNGKEKKSFKDSTRSSFFWGGGTQENNFSLLFLYQIFA